LMRIARKDADRLQPVIGRLIEAVDDDNGNVRGSAAMALAWIACNIQDKTVLTATVTPLLDTLRDPASKGRREAAGALGWVGTRVEDDTAFAPAYLTLIEMLQGDSQVLRNAAAMPIATGTFSVSDEAVLRPAIDPLTRALQDEGFGEMRWATANGLAHIAGRVPDPEAFGATIPVLADCLQDDALANSAAHALQVIVSVLQTEETLEPALPAFLGALTRTDDSYWLARWRAAQGLGYAADMVEDQASLDAMVSALTVALADPHTDVRAMAAWALGRVARATTKPDALDPAIEPLIEVLRTATSVGPLKPKGLVPPISLVGRTLAVSASGSPEALVTALDVLTDGLYHEDPSVRAAAADALAWVAVEAGDQSVVARAMAHLTDALGDQDPYVAWIATFALARLAPNVEKESVLEAPVPMLLDMLQDEAAHMRWAAARALAALAQHVDDSMAMEAAASLSAALRDRRAHVRWAAADALAAVASSAAGERATGGAAIALAGALADSHPRVRRAAARALAEPSVPTSAGVSLAESTFDTDDEGWTYFGPAFNVTHHNTGGAPGSYLAADDQAIGNPWGWLAPQKFLGHMSSAYGGTLDFDLRRMVMMESEHKGLKVTDVQIVLIGGGLRLQLMAPNNPGPDWTSYSIPLEPDVGWRRGGGGASKSPPATESDLRSVLSELQAVRIRVGPNHPWTRWDRTGMDNVVLTSGPTGDG
ncbi:MAG TPA: HEAT repeat domain-containing protein, partial [Armatimonadota bacterium]|nr:HEAT repeat domain-containing protein [Armatimonadota bacterium]